MNREPIKIHNSNFTQGIFPTAYCMPADVRTLEADYAELEADNKKLREALSMWLLCAEAVKDLRLVQVATKTKKLLKEGEL